MELARTLLSSLLTTNSKHKASCRLQEALQAPQLELIKQQHLRYLIKSKGVTTSVLSTSCWINIKTKGMSKYS